MSRRLLTVLDSALGRGRRGALPSEELARGRVLAGVLLIALGLNAFFSWYTWETREPPGVTGACLAGLLLYGGALYYLRAGGSVRLIAIIFCVEINALLVFASFSRDGLRGLSGPFSGLFILATFFMAGVRFGALSGALLIAEMVIFYWAETFGGFVPYPIARSQGSELVGAVLATAALIAVGTLYDTTERTTRRSLEDALARLQEAQNRAMQSEKMAAIGKLASGIAHEINNPLGVILGFAQGLERRTPEADPHRMPISSIVRESIRCKKLVQELLTFSRVGSKALENVDLAELIKATVPLLDARARTQQVCIEAPASGQAQVLGSRTQLQQILVNLGTNALDAMKSGGTLRISLLDKAASVLLVVEDTGTGIPEEIRAQIFEPFFTTKGVGEGTGLGLSLVYEIVNQHGGRIEVTSQVGAGTRFEITLPEKPALVAAAA